MKFKTIRKGQSVYCAICEKWDLSIYGTDAFCGRCGNIVRRLGEVMEYPNFIKVLEEELLKIGKRIIDD